MAESNNPFDLLPVKVIEIIFGFLPDIASLRAAAITSKRLLAVTRGAKMMLITQVVVNHISPELMPEAWLALESERLRPNSVEQVDQFAETHFRNREANPRLITLAEGMAMERRHAAVEYFTAKCSTDARQYLPFLGKLSEEHYGRSFPEYKTNLVADMTETEHTDSQGLSIYPRFATNCSDLSTLPFFMARITARMAPPSYPWRKRALLVGSLTRSLNKWLWLMDICMASSRLSVSIKSHLFTISAID